MPFMVVQPRKSGSGPESCFTIFSFVSNTAPVAPVSPMKYFGLFQLIFCFSPKNKSFLMAYRNRSKPNFIF